MIDLDRDEPCTSLNDRATRPLHPDPDLPNRPDRRMLYKK